MNKKMRELLAKIKEKNLQARNFQNEGKFAEAKQLIDEIKDLQTSYENEKALLKWKGTTYQKNQRTKQQQTVFLLWQRLH